MARGLENCIMIERSQEQKIGDEGEQWLLSEITSHPGPSWIARRIEKDFGIDVEAELSENTVKGEILKLQCKTSEVVPRHNGRVRFDVGRAYVDYALSCRYPVIFIRVELSTKLAWYLWLQDWILTDARASDPARDQQNYTIWVGESQTLRSGLTTSLPEIARWRGPTQLVLSLRDAMRAAAATANPVLVRQIVGVLSEASPLLGNVFLGLILREAMDLGEQLRGTFEGYAVGEQLFALVRTFGEKTTVEAVDAMVRRNDSYSRTGIIGLGILYDAFHRHASSLRLVDHFLAHKLPHVAYYCALREANPSKGYWDFMNGPGDFVFAGLKFTPPEHSNFSDKYANRGPSAILDYLDSV
jgi:hypothetical protein